jgi:hypothetical protein
MVLQNMHIGALTQSIKLHGDTWARQHANLTLPDWPPVPGEPELEVMRPTEDAIPPRPCRVGPSPGPRSDNDDGDDGGDSDDA